MGRRLAGGATKASGLALRPRAKDAAGIVRLAADVPAGRAVRACRPRPRQGGGLHADAEAPEVLRGLGPGKQIIVAFRTRRGSFGFMGDHGAPPATRHSRELRTPRP